MNGLEFVREALSPLPGLEQLAERVAVATHCLYPSNAGVAVFVSGGPNAAIVSDEGGAIDELSTHNRMVPEPDKFLRRFCRPLGLKVENGKIYSPTVPAEKLHSAVVLVANASAAAAHYGFEHIKLHHRRDLRKELRSILERSFEKAKIEAERELAGNSSRPYRFDHVIRINANRLLVIDAVLAEPNSINAHAIAHIDLGQLEDENIVQRMVYDDQEEWRSADLNLLQMASTLVPLSGLEAALHPFVPHGT